jgi:hypothetical protein
MGDVPARRRPRPPQARLKVHPPPGAMLPSPVRAGLAILTGMDLTSRVLVVLGIAAGAVMGVMAVVASMAVVGVDAHGGISELLMTVGGVAGAVIGARVNLTSGRLLVAERSGDFA